MKKQDWLEGIQKRRQTAPVQVPEDARPRLQKLDAIRAVVFDVYGTLFSSGVGDISLSNEGDRNEALQNTLTDHGISIIDADNSEPLDRTLYEHIEQHQKIRRAEGIEFPEVEIRNVWKDFTDGLIKEGRIKTPAPIDIETLVIDFETRVNPTQPMPSLETTLASLRGNGTIMSIISNAQFYTPLLFQAFLGQSYDSLGLCPDSSVWSYRLLEGKPSQQLYRDSAEKLEQHYGIRAEEVLYIGNDMRNDIWPAQAIGFKTALFSGDHLSLRRRKNDSDCRDILPDLEITALSQLVECI